MKFFDSHIHLHSGQVPGWKENKEFIYNNVGINLEDIVFFTKESEPYKNVYLTVGIHPLEIDTIELEEAMNALDKHITDHRDRVIAIGETGFDFYKRPKDTDFEKQRRWYFAHYELAKKHNLPLMLHIRRAHEENLDLLEGLLDWYGILHAYEASEDITDRYLKLKGNWMFSVSPVFLRETSLLRLHLSKIPIERLLVETDSPYLGKHYSEIPNLVQVIADEYKISFEECKQTLWNNFCRFFKLDIK